MLQHIGCFIHKCAILKYMLQHIGRSTPPNFIFCLPLWKNVIYFPNLNFPPQYFQNLGNISLEHSVTLLMLLRSPMLIPAGFLPKVKTMLELGRTAEIDIKVMNMRDIKI